MKSLAATLCLGLSLIGWLPAACQAQVRAEAVRGQPFGVGRIVLAYETAEALASGGLMIEDRQGRVFYPAVAASAGPGRKAKEILSQSRRPLGRIIGNFIDDTGQASLHFLFRGEGPLELTLATQPPLRVTAVPVVQPAAHAYLLGEWWKAYAAPARRADYPPVVENYLKTLLARRLGLPPPAAPAGEAWQAQFEQQLGLQLDGEALRTGMQYQRMLGGAGLDQRADLPPPPPVETPETVFANMPADVKVEPIALHVPEECFYIRFGSYPNFLWFQDTLDRFGGDARNLIAQRGISYRINQRTGKQLVLQDTALGRLFGQAMITDAALIGSDLFLPEGTGTGILFQVNNSLLFLGGLRQQRKEALEQDKSLREEQVLLGDHKVSLVSSADGTVRSYLVSDGDFHLVTNCRSMAQRFLEAGAGERSLGASAEFHAARDQMPLDRNDTVFVYLSDALFRQIARPEYRIEIARRLQAAADVELLQLALLASAAEGVQPGGVPQLIGAGFLPPDFGQRPDGSHALLAGDAVCDSLRGRRGTFLPVADAAVQSVTPAEAAAYARFAQYYQAKWGNIDPLMIGLRRETRENKRERLFLDVRMSPLNEQTYNFLLSHVGTADSLQLAPVRGDALTFDVILQRQRLFGGFRDFGPPNSTGADGLLAAMGLLPFGRLKDYLYGYVGTVGGGIGLLDFLNRRITGPVDRGGFAMARDEVYRRQFDRFTVYSLHYEILAQVTPQIHFEPAPRPAQLRLHVADLSGGKIAPLANRWLFNRSRETSEGNLRLIHGMIEQLHVPGDAAKSAAELVLDAQLLCPMGGKYEWRPAPGGGGRWTSTALEKIGAASRTVAPPAGYEAPPLSWFRGLDLDALLAPGRLSAHAEVEMQ